MKGTRAMYQTIVLIIGINCGGANADLCTSVTQSKQFVRQAGAEQSLQQPAAAVRIERGNLLRQGTGSR